MERLYDKTAEESKYNAGSPLEPASEDPGIADMGGGVGPCTGEDDGLPRPHEPWV